jgi:hypothetical protein
MRLSSAPKLLTTFKCHAGERLWEAKPRGEAPVACGGQKDGVADDLADGKAVDSDWPRSLDISGQVDGSLAFRLPSIPGTSVSELRHPTPRSLL